MDMTELYRDYTRVYARERAWSRLSLVFPALERAVIVPTTRCLIRQ